MVLCQVTSILSAFYDCFTKALLTDNLVVCEIALIFFKWKVFYFKTEQVVGNVSVCGSQCR
jgi:hypothetical protein